MSRLLQAGRFTRRIAPRCSFWLLFGLLAYGGSVRSEQVFVPAAESFVASLQCRVADVIANVHGSPRSRDGSNRFVVLSLGRGQRYVQCRFVDDDAALSCEVSSGFYGPRPRMVLSRASRAAITEAGFVLHRGRGNFVRRFEISTPGDFPRISAAILRTLEKVYDGDSFGGVYVMTSDHDYENIFDIGCFPDSPLLQIPVWTVTVVRIRRM